jgi:hypothetical protein
LAVFLNREFYYPYGIIILEWRVKIVPGLEALIVFFRVKQEFPGFDCLPE